jgi:hypothetical protein
VIGEPGEHLVVAMIKGHLSAANTQLQAGDFAIVPAVLNSDQRQLTDFSSTAEWLEIRIPETPRIEQ